jgi:hypothetical protein
MIEDYIDVIILGECGKYEVEINVDFWNFDIFVTAFHNACNGAFIAFDEPFTSFTFETTLEAAYKAANELCQRLAQ